MGERFPCTEEVAGSNPVSSTYVVVSEWLGNGLQTRVCEFESHPRLITKQREKKMIGQNAENYKNDAVELPSEHILLILDNIFKWIDTEVASKNSELTLEQLDSIAFSTVLGLA